MKLYLQGILQSYLEEKLGTKVTTNLEPEQNFYSEKLSQNYAETQIYLSILDLSVENIPRYRTEDKKVTSSTKSNFSLTLKSFNENELDALEDKVLCVLNANFYKNKMYCKVKTVQIEYEAKLNDFGPAMQLVKLKLELIIPIYTETKKQIITFNKIKIQGEFDDKTEK